MTWKRWMLLAAGSVALACQSTGMGNTREASASRTTDRNARADTATPPPGGGASASGNVGTSSDRSTAGATAQGSAQGSTSDMSTGSSGSTGTMQGSSGAMGSTSGEDMKGHQSDQVLSGRVQQVSDRSITIASQDGQQKELRLSDATLVTVDGRDAKPSEIQEGQQVRASFNQVDGQDVAVKIVAGAAGSDLGSTYGSPHGSTDTGPSTTSPGSPSSTDQSGTGASGTGSTTPTRP
jgi:Cu/Ag efflux protein CusF